VTVTPNEVIVWHEKQAHHYSPFGSNNALTLHHAGCASAVAALQARCAALEADALRYRWLRDSREERMPDGTTRDVYDEDGALLYGASLDAAIDTCLSTTPDAPAEGAKE
jgi:hypothetical protein